MSCLFCTIDRVQKNLKKTFDIIVYSPNSVSSSDVPDVVDSENYEKLLWSPPEPLGAALYMTIILLAPGGYWVCDGFSFAVITVTADQQQVYPDDAGGGRGYRLSIHNRFTFSPLIYDNNAIRPIRNDTAIIAIVTRPKQFNALFLVFFFFYFSQFRVYITIEN